MASSLPTTPTETPELPSLPNDSADIVPDNHPKNYKTRTARCPQIIRDRRLSPSNYNHTLETRVITAIKILSKYKGNTVTKPIKGSPEEYPDVFHVPKSKISTKAFANYLGRLAQVVTTKILTGKTRFLHQQEPCTKTQKGNLCTGCG